MHGISGLSVASFVLDGCGDFFRADMGHQHGPRRMSYHWRLITCCPRLAPDRAWMEHIYFRRHSGGVTGTFIWAIVVERFNESDCCKPRCNTAAGYWVLVCHATGRFRSGSAREVSVSLAAAGVAPGRLPRFMYPNNAMFSWELLPYITWCRDTAVTSRAGVSRGRSDNTIRAMATRGINPSG